MDNLSELEQKAKRYDWIVDQFLRGHVSLHGLDYYAVLEATGSVNPQPLHDAIDAKLKT